MDNKMDKNAENPRFLVSSDDIYTDIPEAVKYSKL